jgi:outer membrane protein assembly factor BamA
MDSDRTMRTMLEELPPLPLSGMMPFRVGLVPCAVAWLFLLIAPATCLKAQVQHASGQTPKSTPAKEQILASYEGQNVTAVEVAGRPQSNSSDFKSLFVQQPGQPYSSEKVNQTVAVLKATGKFDDVRVQVDPEANGVRVLLILEPAVYFGIFEFPGTSQFSYSRLVQIANYPITTPFNQAEVDKDGEDLVTFFRQQGFFQAEVNPEVKIDAAHAIANTLFNVNLKRQARFGSLEFTNLPPDEAAKLQHSLQTLVARGRGVAIRPGRAYHYSTLTRADQYLQAKLQKEGRLGAQVKLAGAEYHADTNRADLHFDVDAGPLTHVAIAGAHVWSWTRKSLLPIYQGIGVDDESVQEGRQALMSYYQAKGLFDVTVDAELKSDNKGSNVIYKISKGKKHKVQEVSISGNSHLPTSDLASHLAVEKSHLFSSGKFSDRLVRTSAKNLKAVYQSEGFGSVQVQPAVTNRGEDIVVTFRVTEGPRDTVNSLKIEGADTVPESELAPGGLKLAAGQPYSQAHVEADRASIVAHYLQSGYLTSSFRETAEAVSKDEPHRIDVVYRIYEGPKVIAGELVTLGRQHTQQRLIDQDVSSIKPEMPLTETELLTAGSKLYEHTGVFDWADVDPKRQITTQTREDVLVKVHEAKRNEFTYGFGFEVINRGGSIPSGTVTLPNLPPVGLPANYKTSQTTFYGPRGTAQYTRNNVGGKGDSFTFTGFAGRLDQRGAAYYIVPEFRWSPWKATTSASVERNEENPVFSAQEELASYQMQRGIDHAKKDTLFLRYSFSQTDLTRIEIPGLVPPADQHVRLSGVGANLTRDTRDNAMDEHRGVLQSIELDINSTKLGSSVNFAKLTTQAAFYKQGFHNIVWANSLRIGLAQPFNNSRVPLSEEFFSGGGSSLRGFPLDGAGPQRAVELSINGCSSPNCPQILVPSGGSELLIINSEARIPLSFKKGLSVVPFYDGGNVFPIPGFHDFTSLYSNNVGLGLRYSTPVGPIRFDLGRNLNPIQGIKATQYFVSIGQAF